MSSSLKFWKASTNVNESKQVSPIFMILWPRQQLPKPCNWWKLMFLSLKVEFVILWFYNLIYLVVILWVYHLFMYIVYGHLMPFGLILLLITVYSCEILWVWIFTSAPRGATSSASRSVRFPMAFQNRRCFILSNMMFKCLKICLTSARSWPDLVMTLWHQHDHMFINGHYRYSQRLLQAAGDKGMLGPSGSKSSSSSASGFFDWIAISYRVIRDIFPRCRIGHSVIRLRVSNCYFRSYSKLPGCMSWCCWWHCERQAERATACNTWELQRSLSSNKICIIFRILNNVIQCVCMCYRSAML